MVTPLEIKVNSETGTLKNVVIGYPHNFHIVPPEVVNKTQARHYASEEKPTIDSLVPEFEEFKTELRDHGVTVYEPKPVQGVPDQLTVRDIGFVIDDTFVVAGMLKDSRKQEWRGVSYLIEQIDPSKVLHVPGGIVVEGGDVHPRNGYIFVGVGGQRTSMEGARFLQKNFPDYEVVPLRLRGLETGEDVLHTDTVLGDFGTSYGVIYPQGFVQIPRGLEASYSNLFEISKKEQEALVANMLAISPELEFSLGTQEAQRVNNLIRSKGVFVIEIKFNEAAKTGGSLHCCSLPLFRE